MFLSEFLYDLASNLVIFFGYLAFSISRAKREVRKIDIKLEKVQGGPLLVINGVITRINGLTNGYLGL